MSNIVQTRNGVQVSRMSIFSEILPVCHGGVELPGVLTVVPKEGDRLCLSPVSDVGTVPTINEDLIISVSPACNTKYKISSIAIMVAGKPNLPFTSFPIAPRLFSVSSSFSLVLADVLLGRSLS